MLVTLSKLACELAVSGREARIEISPGHRSSPSLKSLAEFPLKFFLIAPEQENKFQH